jgi:hypothetical protein
MGSSWQQAITMTFTGHHCSVLALSDKVGGKDNVDAMTMCEPVEVELHAFLMW